MKTILKMEEAEVVLKNYFSILNDSVKEGMDDLNDFIRAENQKRFISFSRRAKSTLLNEYITNRLITKCTNLEGVSIRSTGNNGFPFLVFNNEIVARVKKLDNELAPANIPTKITKAYNSQYPIKVFPDKPTHVYFGYRVDSTGSNINGVYVVCRIKKQIQWYIDLTHELKAEQTSYLVANQPKDNPTSTRVRIKLDPNKEQSKNTGTDK